MGGSEVMESEAAEEERATIFQLRETGTQCWGCTETLDERGKIGKGIKVEAMGKIRGWSTDDEEQGWTV